MWYGYVINTDISTAMSVAIDAGTTLISGPTCSRPFHNHNIFRWDQIPPQQPRVQCCVSTHPTSLPPSHLHLEATWLQELGGHWAQGHLLEAELGIAVLSCPCAPVRHSQGVSQPLPTRQTTSLSPRSSPLRQAATRLRGDNHGLMLGYHRHEPPQQHE